MSKTARVNYYITGYNEAKLEELKTLLRTGAPKPVVLNINKAEGKLAKAVDAIALELNIPVKWWYLPREIGGNSIAMLRSAKYYTDLSDQDCKAWLMFPYLEELL